MYEIKQETLKKAYKPYDIVTDKDGNVGFIQEVNVNDCQEGFNFQISYSIEWMVFKDQPKTAWWSHNELTKHGNIFIKIAECSCHNMGHNNWKVKALFNNWE